MNYRNFVYFLVVFLAGNNIYGMGKTHNDELALARKRVKEKYDAQNPFEFEDENNKAALQIKSEPILTAKENDEIKKLIEDNKVLNEKIENYKKYEAGVEADFNKMVDEYDKEIAKLKLDIDNRNLEINENNVLNDKVRNYKKISIASFICSITASSILLYGYIKNLVKSRKQK